MGAVAEIEMEDDVQTDGPRAMPALNDAEEALQQMLLDERVLEPRQLNQVLAAREQAWQRALRRFVGIYASIDNSQLTLIDYARGRELGSFELESRPDPEGLPGTLLYLGADGEIERGTAPDSGLLLTSEGCWIQSHDPLDMPLLGLSQRLQLLPDHDLAISPRRDLLAVSERHAGRLQIISLNRPQVLGEIELRESGCHKAINLCFTPAGPHKGRLWLTDSVSDRLGWLEPGSKDLQWFETGLGRLGQLVMDPDGETLYLLALTPLLRLLKLDPVSLEVLGELDVPGTPASLSPGVPVDVLEWLPAQTAGQPGELLALTQLVDQDTPALLRIGPDLRLDAEPQALPPLAGWASLVPGLPNPVQKWASRRLDDWIAELEFLTTEHLARLRQQARFGNLMSPRSTSYEIPQAAEDPLTTICREAPPIHLPNEAVDVIVELMAQSFQAENGLDLRSRPAELERLRAEAVVLRQEIEQRYVILAELEDLCGSRRLQLVLERENLLRSLDYHLGGRQLPFRPGHCCPICALSVKNPRFCPQCGFALDDPDLSERRELQSAESCSELIPGQMVLAVPHVRQIVFLDAWLQVISELSGRKGSDSPLQEPVHVLALPEGDWLVCDAGAKAVYELTPGGELVALFDHRFQQPVMATFRREAGALRDILVLDAGAGEICAMTRDGRLDQSWGAAEGLRLKDPAELQWTWAESFLLCEPETPRVLEWNPASQETLASWGPKQGLVRPVLARRQLNGETLIADAGLGEILIFGEDPNVLARRFRYWPPPGHEALVEGQPAPDQMLMLPTGDLLCFGRKYWMQLQTSLGRIRWVQPWTGKRRPLQQKKQLAERGSEDESLKRLRQMHLLNPLDTNALVAIAAELEPVAVAAGQWALKAKDLNGILFFILAGEVEIRRPDDPAEHDPVAVLGPGESFGEVPLILSEPFAAGFWARSDLQLLQLKRSNYKKAIAKASALAPALRDLAQQRKRLLELAGSGQTNGMMEKVKAQLAVKRLQEIKLFAHADEALLLELAECMRPLAFMPAKQVYAQDEMCEGFYFISRGKVGLTLEGAASAFLELGPGDVFGEMALLNQQIHPAGARTESYCQLYQLDMTGFSRLMLQRPDLKDELTTLAMERLPLLEAARSELAYAPEAANSLPQAEVLALTRLRPALSYIASGHHEQAFCLDDTGQVLWAAEGGKARLYRPCRLHVGDDLIWIADSGQDRVLALTKADGRYVRELTASRLGLSQPRSVVQTLHQHLLIADEGNQRLLLVSTAGERLWEYGAPHEIMSPWFAEQTLKGTVLFADRALHMVFEVDPKSKTVVWSYGSMMNPGNGPEELNEPACVRRLSNGATLIVDTGNDRLLLLSPVGTLMRSFEGSDEIPMPRPLHVELMASGEMWVYPEAGESLIRLGNSGQPVWRAQLPR
ncbi:MAG: hypothetical protein CVV27_01190 [Candidatus Melainabacteria bacterium HGW-Melainabacteria-1]|nr:MAG: hypothetical protein CVV27_01190 [Candidatus Melainabacteria bacterium HGW-Melainabacteria-1]